MGQVGVHKSLTLRSRNQTTQHEGHEGHEERQEEHEEGPFLFMSFAVLHALRVLRELRVRLDVRCGGSAESSQENKIPGRHGAMRLVAALAVCGGAGILACGGCAWVLRGADTESAAAGRVEITATPPHAIVGFTVDFQGRQIKLRAAPTGGLRGGGKYTWSVVEGAGEFERKPGWLFGGGTNGTRRAQEVLFRASAEGLTKVTVAYTREGRTYEVPPVEFMSYAAVTIQLELQDPIVNGVCSGLDESTLRVVLNGRDVPHTDLTLERTWATIDDSEVLTRLKITYKPNRDKLRPGRNTVTADIQDKVKNPMDQIATKSFTLPAEMW